MRSSSSALLFLFPALGLGCGSQDTGAAVTQRPVTPVGGTYQATLQSYAMPTGVPACDAALTEPAGVFDASTRFDYLDPDTVQLAGSRLWHYGGVVLHPGDPKDVIDRASWKGAAQTGAEVSGCKLLATVSFQYFPADDHQGTLRDNQQYALSSGTCALKLPCETRATWSLVQPR